MPFVGTAKGVIEAGTGRDLLTGEELAPWERALGILPLVGGLTALKYADDIAGFGRHGDGLGHRGDDIASTGTHLDDVPGPPRFDVGHTWALPAEHRGLVTQYDAAGTAARRGLAEQLGLRGGEHYLSQSTGRTISSVRPVTDADVAPLVDLARAGQPWPHAIAYPGSRATNLVYYDGNTLTIVEAKGGGAGYGDRFARFVDDDDVVDGRISQTHPEYPRDVAYDMRKSQLTDGRNALGDLIEDMYDKKTVEYVGVRTGGYQNLLTGDPRITLQHRFLTPPTP
ncbi:MAG: pre-toxin TG domain-containing protein [Phycicoccus sp.]